MTLSHIDKSKAEPGTSDGKRVVVTLRFEDPSGREVSEYSDIDTDFDDYHDGDHDHGDEEEVPGGKRPICRKCMKSRFCSINMYLWIVVFLIGCLISLIVVGVLVVAPFRKASSFQEATCDPIGKTIWQSEQKCSCGKGCNARFPCIEIKVKFIDRKSQSHQTTIYDNEAMLRRQCSYHPPCRSSRDRNKDAVLDYRHKYGTPGSTYSCLYNPNNPKEVIRTRRYKKDHVIHGLAWTSGIFVILLIVLLVALKRKGCKF